MRRNTAGLAAAGLGLSALLFLSVNSLAGRVLGQGGFDLTEQGLYTLSPGTRAVLSKIDEPVTLRLYYSTALGTLVPSYGVYAQQVRQMLGRYASLSGGKVKLEVLDPVPYSDVEDQATNAGLQAVRAEEGGEQLYFGLAGTNSTDDSETIPFFQRDREKFLEYDITKLVQSLAHPTRKSVGLMSSIPLDGDPMAEMQGRPQQPQTILTQLREAYDVRELPPSSDSIPDDIDVLMLVQPQKLSPKTEYAIDQFVLRGGRALVFADPYSEFQAAHASPMGGRGGGPTAADETKLLAAWGVAPIAGKLVEDRQAARRVNPGGPDAQPIDYLLWLGLRGTALNPNDPVTAKLGNVNVATAGALEPAKGATTQFTPLLSSGIVSGLVDAKQAAGPIPDFDGLLKGFKPEQKRFTIAARLTGPAHTAFPEGPPKEKDGKAPPAPQIKESQGPINVIVVADTDMLDDRFWVQYANFVGRRIADPFAGNADFVLNAIDSLLGTGDLIGLRARGSAIRPFTLVDQMRRDADDRYRAHEKELQAKLRDTQEKLASIKPAQESEGEVQLTPEQQKTVENFRAEIVRTRSELRSVQLALRQGIDALKNRLVLLDVALVPALVALVALAVGSARVRRRRARATS